MQTAQILTVHTNVNALKVTEEMGRIVQVNMSPIFSSAKSRQKFEIVKQKYFYYF
jgi:hypothetical protein